MTRLFLSCLIGLIIGLFSPANWDVSPIMTSLLPILLFSVGMSLGNENILLLVSRHRKFLLLPVFSLIGSFLFSFLLAIISNINVKETVLTGSAMGFYSLPALMVSAKIGVTAGTLLLLTNMIREAITILLAPFISKLFGGYSLIAVGGATTMDVSLAIIKESGGNEIVPIAVLNGLVLTLGVPFIISLLLNLNF